MSKSAKPASDPIDVVQTDAWKNLSKLFATKHSTTLSDLFQGSPDRAEKFFLKFENECGSVCLDYSKNHIDEEVMAGLVSLAREVGLEDQIETLFKGGKTNATEDRAALHTALRNPDLKKFPQIKTCLARMKKLSADLGSGNKKGYSGKKLEHLLHIGIGGSYLGPHMVDEALGACCRKSMSCDYLANVDGNQLNQILDRINPEKTLVIIASKSFTTIETLINASAVKEHFLKSIPSSDIGKHLIAVTADTSKAEKFGVSKDHIFPMWDYVGGRYSLWSAVGLPVCLSYGYEVFNELLKGAHEMDEHFHASPFAENIPLTLALLNVWYTNFFGSKSQAVIPYDHSLRLLPAHLQQLVMESNGKSVRIDGAPVNLSTSPVIWGDEGTNGQHAFHQLLHQGTEMIPIDFVLPLAAKHGRQEFQDQMVANCLAQSRALMIGQSAETIAKQLSTEGLDKDAAEKLAAHKFSPGNRPSNTLLLSSISPYSLGALIAMYEHRVFCEAMLWQINPFDQWGVELGKTLGDEIYCAIQNGALDPSLDASTRHLLAIYQSVPRS